MRNIETTDRIGRYGGMSFSERMARVIEQLRRASAAQPRPNMTVGAMVLAAADVIDDLDDSEVPTDESAPLPRLNGIVPIDVTAATRKG